MLGSSWPSTGNHTVFPQSLRRPHRSPLKTAHLRLEVEQMDGQIGLFKNVVQLQSEFLKFNKEKSFANKVICVWDKVRNEEIQ